MPRVRPFRAWTYARTSPDISSLVAPPYDVVSDRERASLLERDPHNIIALELPEGPLDPNVPGNRYGNAARRWQEWRESGVVVRDSVPALYVLEQRFELAGSRVRRRAFIGEVRLHAFEEGVILPHERTLPKAVSDRYNLIRATGANFSPVFALFTDSAGVTDGVFDSASSAEPALRASDEAGVETLCWPVTDADAIGRVADTLATGSLLIADGHHRYSTALAYRDARREADAALGAFPNDPDYDYVMMALVNMDDPDLIVLPTHRVARGRERPFDATGFLDGLAVHFELRELEPGHPSKALEGIPQPAFLVRTKADDRPRLAVLRETFDVDEVIPAPHSRAWKELDVSVLQELVLKPLLGIHPDAPETLERLAFPKDAHEALAAVQGEFDVAFVLRPTRMDQMRAVSLAGETMPQKSTYFYPKLPSGVVLREIG